MKSHEKQKVTTYPTITEIASSHDLDVTDTENSDKVTKAFTQSTPLDMFVTVSPVLNQEEVTISDDVEETTTSEATILEKIHEIYEDFKSLFTTSPTIEKTTNIAETSLVCDNSTREFSLMETITEENSKTSTNKNKYYFNSSISESNHPANETSTNFNKTTSLMRSSSSFSSNSDDDLSSEYLNDRTQTNVVVQHLEINEDTTYPTVTEVPEEFTTLLYKEDVENYVLFESFEFKFPDPMDINKEVESETLFRLIELELNHDN